MREIHFSLSIVIKMKEQNECKGAEKKEVSFERKTWGKEVREGWRKREFGHSVMPFHRAQG